MTVFLEATSQPMFQPSVDFQGRYNGEKAFKNITDSTEVEGSFQKERLECFSLTSFANECYTETRVMN